MSVTKLKITLEVEYPEPLIGSTLSAERNRLLDAMSFVVDGGRLNAGSKVLPIDWEATIEDEKDHKA